MMSMMRRELVMLKRRGAQHFQLKEGKKIPKKPQESWTTHPGEDIQNQDQEGQEEQKKTLRVSRTQQPRVSV
jgi:hypothetical protein